MGPAVEIREMKARDLCRWSTLEEVKDRILGRSTPNAKFKAQS